MKTVCIVVMMVVLTACSHWGNVYQGSSMQSLRYGIRLVELKQNQEALKLFKKAAEQVKEPAHKAGIYNNIAIIYEVMGETELAREWYKKALELYPDSDIYENYRRFTGDE